MVPLRISSKLINTVSKCVYQLNQNKASPYLNFHNFSTLNFTYSPIFFVYPTHFHVKLLRLHPFFIYTGICSVHYTVVTWYSKYPNRPETDSHHHRCRFMLRVSFDNMCRIQRKIHTILRKCLWKLSNVSPWIGLHP